MPFQTTLKKVTILNSTLMAFPFRLIPAKWEKTKILLIVRHPGIIMLNLDLGGFMKNFLLTLIWMVSPAILALDSDLIPLEGALWQGELTLAISGIVQGQYLNNQLDKNGTPIGFSKEKANLELDYQLVIHFQVNALGEVTFLANEQLEGERTMNRELWRKLLEETVQAHSSVTYMQLVKIAENRYRNHPFKSHRVLNHNDPKELLFRVKPGGRMDRKGSLEIEGNLPAIFSSEGLETNTWERQPAFVDPKKESKTKKTFKTAISLGLPLNFKVTIQHRKKPLEGNVNVTASVTNPFDFDNLKEGDKPIVNEKLTAKGSYRLTPLFGDK